MSDAFDVLIIGSGFGGSVSALRLAEKGYRVAVLEQGRDLTSADLQRAGLDAGMEVLREREQAVREARALEQAAAPNTAAVIADARTSL